MEYSPVIGIDFDNTIISYDEIMHKFAVQWDFIEADSTKSKKEIRNKIRLLPDGEMKWQKLQAVVYGTEIEQASLPDGVLLFIKGCKKNDIPVYIVSHKTAFASFDKTVNLRQAALSWMQKNGFFNSCGLSRKNVYFESTRHEKIDRIRHLKCTHFVDDLEETFLEPSFPASVKKFLYAPHTRHSFLPGVKVVSSWTEINDYFFNG